MIELANKPACFTCGAKTWDGSRYVCDMSKLAIKNKKPTCGPQKRQESTPSVQLLARKVLGK